MLEKTKEKIKELEKQLEENNLQPNKYVKEAIETKLARLRTRLKVLENNDMDKAAADMKAILSHTIAVEDKYKCRSVKFMFRVVEFLDKHISKSLAEKLRNYTIHEIHAPVCSIVGNPKPELEPMPKCNDPKSKIEAAHEKEIADFKKYRDLWVGYIETKPSRWERVKAKINAVKTA